MKQVEVKILGQGYSFSCPDDAEARLRDTVKTVDTAMQRIQDAGKVHIRERIAVLAAVNLVFDGAVVQGNDPAVPTTLSEEASTQLGVVLARLDQALGDMNGAVPPGLSTGS